MTVRLLPDLLRDAAGTTPEGVALRGEGDVTYAALLTKAARTANALRALGVRRGDRVAVFAAKSADTVAALYAVMWCGAAYVPIDPGSPAARAAMILRSAEVRTMVVDAGRRPTAVGLAAEIEHVESLLVITEDSTEGEELESDARIVVQPRGFVDEQPDGFDGPGALDVDLAYVLYTSGSTGVPKGVMLTHAHAMGFVDWAAAHFGLRSDDRLSSHAPFHFDLSVLDLYAAARVGASVSLVPAKASIFPTALASFIEEQELTTWYSVPSILNALLLRGGLEPGRLPSLRNVIFAGEVFPSTALRGLMEMLPGARFTNLYGPTETNVCTYYDVERPPRDDEDIPIGRAIDNVETLIVDNGRVVEPGDKGELWVRGRAVMSGYLGDDTKTAASLAPDPRFPHLPDRLYRTGDLVRQNDHGDLEFLGRNDNQVKSRGYRIELGEIETALNSHPSVTECAVVAVPDPVFTNKIKAYVVADEDERALRRHCGERLPSYMVPDMWDAVEALPRTSTGKIDRWALAHPSVP